MDTRIQDVGRHSLRRMHGPLGIYPGLRNRHRSGRGDDTTNAKSIPLVLKGVALTWFFTIPPRSIYAWGQLRDLVCNKFEGNNAEPKDA